MHFELGEIGNRGDGAAFARRLAGDAERRDRFTDLCALLDHYPVKRGADVGILERFFSHPDARPRRRDHRFGQLHARSRDGGGRFSAGQTGVGRNPVFGKLALAFDVARIFVACSGILRHCCLGFAHGTARRLELRVDVRMLDLSDHRALFDPCTFFEFQRRNSAADFHTDVAAVARHDVPGRDHHGQRSRAAGRRHYLCRTGDLHFRGTAFGDVGAG